jgi:hypothetical protein
MSTEGMSDPEHEFWIVDRVTAGVAILVEGGGELVAEVAEAELGPHAVEGAVLVVPLGAVGEPVWSRAERDPDRERESRPNAETERERLREPASGGDVEA